MLNGGDPAEHYTYKCLHHLPDSDHCNKISQSSLSDRSLSRPVPKVLMDAFELSPLAYIVMQ